MSSESSILNHFKRKTTDEATTETAAKRLKVPPPTPKSPSIPSKPTSSPLKGDFLFQIAPPEFEVERSEVPGREIRKQPDLDLLVYKPFLTKSCAKTLYKYLLTSLPWYKVIYKRGPLTITTPRYTTVFGRDDISPPTTKYKRTPRPIPPALMQLKALVEAHTDTTYNFCLVNFYSNGKDSISYHSDDEHFLGPLPTIASLSLGGERDFFLKNKADNKLVEKYLLQNGDMVVMRGETQSKWLHAIPKRTRAEPRIKYTCHGGGWTDYSITFRKAINKAGTDNYYHYNVNEGNIFRWVNGQMVDSGETGYAAK